MNPLKWINRKIDEAVISVLCYFLDRENNVIFYIDANGEERARFHDAHGLACPSYSDEPCDCGYVQAE